MSDTYYFEELLDLSAEERYILKVAGFYSIQELLNTTIVEYSLIKGIYEHLIVCVVEALAIWKDIKEDETIREYRESVFFDKSSNSFLTDDDEALDESAVKKYLLDNDIKNDEVLMGLTLKRLLSIPKMDKVILHQIIWRTLKAYSERFRKPELFFNRRDLTKNRSLIFSKVNVDE